LDDRSFEEAMQKIIRGEKDGLKEVYEAYAACIYTTIYALVKHKETAQDLTSEFFIKLWHIAEQYKFGGRHKAWLMTIARNLAVDAMRRQKYETAETEAYENMKAPDDPENSTVTKVSFRDAMKQLDEKEEAVLTLKFMGQCTFREIAEILHMPMGTVTWKYTRGIEKLRRSEYGR